MVDRNGVSHRARFGVGLVLTRFGVLDTRARVARLNTPFSGFSHLHSGCQQAPASQPGHPFGRRTVHDPLGGLEIDHRAGLRWILTAAEDQTGPRRPARSAIRFGTGPRRDQESLRGETSDRDPAVGGIDAHSSGRAQPPRRQVTNCGQQAPASHQGPRLNRLTRSPRLNIRDSVALTRAPAVDPEFSSCRIFTPEPLLSSVRQRPLA